MVAQDAGDLHMSQWTGIGDGPGGNLFCFDGHTRFFFGWNSAPDCQYFDLEHEFWLLILASELGDSCSYIQCGPWGSVILYDCALCSIFL